MGTAFILRPSSSRSAFRDNDVLVASDLSPEDLSLIERSSAVVLDAGSYYGFAGVTARILKKPSIFGTKIATMVLQNGDKLNIDGKRGVARLVDSDKKSWLS